MFCNTRKNKRQKGFTLVELVIVLGIVVVGVIAILGRQNSTNQASRVMTESGNLQTIVGKVNASFAGRASYAGLSTAFLLDQGAFPTSMVNGTNVVNVWNGAVTVASGTGDTSFDITTASVPTGACIELVTTTSRSFRTVTVGTTVVKTAAQAQADLATTQTACAAATTTSIIFNAAA